MHTNTAAQGRVVNKQSVLLNSIANLWSRATFEQIEFGRKFALNLDIIFL